MITCPLGDGCTVYFTKETVYKSNEANELTVIVDERWSAHWDCYDGEVLDNTLLGILQQLENMKEEDLQLEKH